MTQKKPEIELSVLKDDTFIKVSPKTWFDGAVKEIRSLDLESALLGCKGNQSTLKKMIDLDGEYSYLNNHHIAKLAIIDKAYITHFNQIDHPDIVNQAIIPKDKFALFPDEVKNILLGNIRINTDSGNNGKPDQKTRQRTKINKAKKARELFNILIENPDYELSEHPEQKELLISAKSTIAEIIKERYRRSYPRALKRINPKENNYFNRSNFIKVFGFRNEIHPVILKKIMGSFFRYAKLAGYKITLSDFDETNFKIETNLNNK